ncbi:hypothetical protein V5799_028435 [Amblyomma americanum]|uniref:Uncharacterized protein n=1 Tax=Amblyomma americanum TaxID=6943 RepID=A0AAQ4DCV8_AMBAM
MCSDWNHGEGSAAAITADCNCGSSHWSGRHHGRGLRVSNWHSTWLRQISPGELQYVDSQKHQETRLLRPWFDNRAKRRLAWSINVVLFLQLSLRGTSLRVRACLLS